MAILRTVKEAGCGSGSQFRRRTVEGLKSRLFAGEQIIFNGTSKEIWEIEDSIERRNLRDSGRFAL
jgi:hypothetical protein